jgi:hypothetical protein
VGVSVEPTHHLGGCRLLPRHVQSGIRKLDHVQCCNETREMSSVNRRARDIISQQEIERERSSVKQESQRDIISQQESQRYHQSTGERDFKSTV